MRLLSLTDQLLQANGLRYKDWESKEMKFWNKLGLGVLGLCLLLGAWSLIEPYTIAVEEETVTIPNLPAAWQGKRIAQVSDFQVGMWGGNSQTIRWVIRKLVEADPAAVLISGDFIYHAIPNPTHEIQKVTTLMRPLLQSDVPVYAVLGNHDYGMKTLDTPAKKQLAQRLEQALEAAGVTVLRNEAAALSPKQPTSPNPIQVTRLSPDLPQTLYLVGIDAHLPQESNPQLAFAGVDLNNPRIVMMHNPKTFASLPPQTAPLAVAGHTHGGQVRLPFTPGWSWLTEKRPGIPEASGWYFSKESGNRLYVNRGIGFSLWPIRLNSPPELTLFTLIAP